jgi:hypothetical protein
MGWKSNFALHVNLAIHPSPTVAKEKYKVESGLKLRVYTLVLLKLHSGILL